LTALFIHFSYMAVLRPSLRICDRSELDALAYRATINLQSHFCESHRYAPAEVGQRQLMHNGDSALLERKRRADRYNQQRGHSVKWITSCWPTIWTESRSLAT